MGPFIFLEQSLSTVNRAPIGQSRKCRTYQNQFPIGAMLMDMTFHDHNKSFNEAGENVRGRLWVIGETGHIKQDYAEL
jgi:hypothetical protein